MGQKITKLKPVGGFCAETSGAITLFVASASVFPCPRRTRSPGPSSAWAPRASSRRCAGVLPAALSGPGVHHSSVGFHCRPAGWFGKQLSVNPPGFTGAGSDVTPLALAVRVNPGRVVAGLTGVLGGARHCVYEAWPAFNVMFFLVGLAVIPVFSPTASLAPQADPHHVLAPVAAVFIAIPDRCGAGSILR